MEDWNNPDKPYKKIKYRGRHCKQEDFGTSKEDINLYESWSGFSLHCADMSTNKLELESVSGSMVNKNIVISVERCQNSTENNNHCHSNQDINDFIK